MLPQLKMLYNKEIVNKSSSNLLVSSIVSKVAELFHDYSA